MTKATHKDAALQFPHIQRKEQQTSSWIHWKYSYKYQINIPSLFLKLFGLGVIMGLFVTVITLRGWNQGSAHHLPSPLNTPGGGKQHEQVDGWADAGNNNCRAVCVFVCMYRPCLCACFTLTVFVCVCVCVYIHRFSSLVSSHLLAAVRIFWLDTCLLHL